VLGKVLELQRKSLQWNQEEMAKRLGTSQSAWSRVETGQSNLSVEELAVVAHVLKTRPEDVLRDVQRSLEHLQKRGVMVLIGHPKAEDTTGAALLGAAALGALLVAILAAGKK
jgi:transcriptional regulator with XRE-family HTH domain